MNIDEAARATRRYLWVHGFVEDVDIGKMLGPFETHRKAQAACDRMNLRAVLEAIRGFGGPFAPDYEMVIDAIIEEVGK